MDTSNVALGYVYMLVSTTSFTAMAAVSKILGTCASTEEKVVRCHNLSVGELLNLLQDIFHVPAASNEGGAGLDKDGWTWHHDHIGLC